MDVVAIIVLCLTLAGALDNQLEGPQNTVSVVGSNVTLRCSSPSRSCNDTEWLKYGASGSLITVSRDRLIISSAYRDRYNVDNSSGCDLVIKYVQLTDAGRFICRAFISSNTVEKSAYLIIQVCTITTSRNEIEEGEDMLLNCTVTYNGIKRASMVWEELEDLPVHVENGETINHSVYVVASAPEVPSFTCVTSFPANYEGSQIHGLAANIPNTTCASSTIKVLSNKQFQVEGPQNTLSVVGRNITLKCVSPSRNCNGIEWLKYSSGNQITLYNDGQGILNAHRDRYSVDGSSSCDLVIRNAQLTDAGRFVCSATILTRVVEKTAYLQILETQPKCTIITYSDKLAAGDEVRLNCVVTYNGLNTASMTWKGVKDAPEAVKSEKTISRSYFIIASAHEVSSFTCLTTFAIDSKDYGGAPIRGLSRNSLNATCATSTIGNLSNEQFQVEGPQNTLSVVGTDVTLKCLSPSRNCSGIEWLKYSSGNRITVYNDRQGILNTHRDRYSVDGSSSCDLVIRNAQLIDVGRFVCSATLLTRVVEKTAYLHILETGPKCTIYASFDDTVEGDRVQLNCRWEYDERKTTKTAWNGVEDAPAAERNGNTLIWSYYVAAAAPEVPSFTCITSWTNATSNNNRALIRGLARNIPNVTCATPALKVLHSARDVQLSPSLANYTTGDRITCMAKGHPSPTLKWQETDDDGTWMDIQNQNGCEFSMTNVSSKRYRCVAMNDVRGNSYNAASHEFLFNNTDTTMTLPHITMTSRSLPLIISVAVGAAFGFLLITLPVNCFLVRACPGYKCYHSGSKSKDKIRKEQSLIEIPDISNYANRVQDTHSSAKHRPVPPGEPSNRPQVATPQDMMSQTDNQKTGRAKPLSHVHKGKKDTEDTCTST